MNTLPEPLRPSTSALEVQRIPIGSISTDPANARTHSDRNLEAIRGSLARFGQQKPIVVDEHGRIIAGNGTYDAARALGWTEIQVVVTDLAGIDATAYAIADNRTTDLSEFDPDSLSTLLAELRLEDALDGVGFDEGEIDAMIAELGDGGRVELDDPGPEALPGEPVSRVGDLWLLGDHRLVCGDSRDPDVLDRLLDGERADLVWTDPPYGVDYVGRTSDALTIRNDKVAGLGQLLEIALRNVAERCRPGAVWYVAAPAGPPFAEFARVLSQLGVWRQMLVWVKDAFVLGGSDFHYRHEALVYGWLPGGEHRRPEERVHDSVWEHDRPRRSPDHPTSKPVELVAHALELSSASHDLVLDPFLGSGTTLMASEQLRRRCRAVEVDPRYVDVAVRRWEEATGAVAVLSDTGEDFARIAAERQGAS